MDRSNKLSILQCNLDRSRNSLHEFVRCFMAGNYSFALISEPYIGSNTTMKSIPGLHIFQFPGVGKVKSCILAKSSSPPTIGMAQFSTPNLSVAQLNIGARKVYLASAYVEPGNDDLGTLESIDYFLKQTIGSQCILGGDFNGWHALWGSDKTNARGNAIVELAHSNELYFCNTDNVPTFETITHGRSRSSIIDLTLASVNILDRVSDWRVNLDVCPSSQHNAISFAVNFDAEFETRPDSSSTFRYKSQKANWAVFKSSLHTRMSLSNILDRDVQDTDKDNLDHLIDDITRIIRAACEDSMPVKSPGSRSKPPWWTEALESRKREVIDLHRRLHNAKRLDLPTDGLAEEHASKKNVYSAELREASTQNFRAFCELQTKENVWSLTNRLLRDAAPRRPPTTIKINNGHTTDAHGTATALINHFYPDDTPDTLDRHHGLRRHVNITPHTLDDPPFVADEVLEILKFMNPKKAPGLDNLTSDICYQFAIAYPTLMTDILNRCLTLGYFPRQWKKAYVKIIPKPNKQDCSALNSYRPIGLITVFGKLLEKLFIKRVTFTAEKGGKLSKRQFGFREQTNTTQAIDSALGRIRQAKTAGDQVLAVSLDIKAAFDNAWWPALMDRLRKIGCPRNVFTLIQSYLADRQVILDYASTRVDKATSKGCIQGSTCGPILWNLILDELLSMELPSGCHIQAFADDVLLITQARRVDDLQETTNRALQAIFKWGESVKLEFGAPKTQIIAFTPKAKTANININGQTINFARNIKLLGVVIDDKLSFNDHIHHIINKATHIFNKLCLYCRPTWGAHPENVRAIYEHVIEPIVTYAAGIWGHVVGRKGIKRKLLSMQRGFAIKTIKSFRTISTSAALALAHFIPLDLKVREVHLIETTRIQGTTNLLPHDITLERNTPPHELLHPAHRLTLTHKLFTKEDDIPHQTQNSIHIYTDGSKLEDSRVGAAFVCYNATGELSSKRFKLHDSCSVFQAELFAIHKACLWAGTQQNNTHVAIFSDSMAALLAIRNRSNTHPLVSAIHHTIQNHNIKIELAWVRSHVGITGNEAADTAAKRAATLHRAADYTSFPISYVKHRIRTENRMIWQNRYESAPQGKHTRDLLPRLDDIRKLWTKTKPSFYLTQTLTGHGFNKDYLHRFKITRDNTCPCDDISAQTIKHLLEHCPRFARTRANHISLCEYLKLPPFKLTKVLTKTAAIKSFVELTTSILGKIKEFNR